MKTSVKVLGAIAGIMISATSICGATPSEYNTKVIEVTSGSYQYNSWDRVEVEYTVQDEDTIDSIADDFIKLNTYGQREHNEFISGIKELNYPVDLTNIHAGDKLKITYWTK